MKTEIFTYIIEDKWKKPGSDIKTPKYGYLGCEYDFPDTRILKNVDKPTSEEEKKGLIVLSFAPPEWGRVKRFARLILTKEEAAQLKKQL